jgi:sigma-B regulation protein RsbU (phosphoserine phosphatase)
VPYLRLSSIEGPGEVVPLHRGRLLVGRSRDCDLVLPDVLLSRRHAEFVETPTGWRVKDLDSMNGTRLNEERFRGERPLGDGDVVVVAGWRLTFVDAETPTEAELTPSHGERVQDITSLATKSGIDIGDLNGQSRLLGVLTRAAGALVSASSAEQLFDTLLADLLAALPARRGAVALLEGTPPVPVVVATRPVEHSMAVDPVVAERVLAGRGALLAPRVPTEDGTVRSVLCAPLWFTGPGEGTDRVVGLVALEAAAEPTPFQEEHPGILSAVVNLAASRLESVRLREETADKRRLEEDLRGAARIQASLLPEEEPVLQGWEIGGSSRLCSAVGADYYDFAHEGGVLLVALGDVAGKGLAAALLMAALRAAVRAIWTEPDSLPRLVARVNENLCQTLPPNRYGTLFLGRLDPETGELRYVNAGHAPAILVRTGSGLERLETGGSILGTFPSASWEEGQVHIGPGDVLVLVSDGVVGALGPALTPEAIETETRRADDDTVPELLAGLQSAADTALGQERGDDDHTFVVLKRQPA